MFLEVWGGFRMVLSGFDEDFKDIMCIPQGFGDSKDLLNFISQ